MLLAVFNDGAMIALSKDRVVASPMPNTWNLKVIFISGIVYGLYLTASSWALFFTASKTQVRLCEFGQAVPCYTMCSPDILWLNCLVAGPYFSCSLTFISVALLLLTFDLLVPAVLQGQMSHVHLEHKDQGGVPLLQPTDSILGLSRHISVHLHGEAAIYTSI